MRDVHRKPKEFDPYAQWNGRKVVKHWCWKVERLLLTASLMSDHDTSCNYSKPFFRECYVELSVSFSKMSCVQCGDLFMTRTDMVRHNKYAPHAECELCERRFLKREDMYRHVKAAHSGAEVEEKRSLRCQECKKRFTRKRKQLKHECAGKTSILL